MARRSQASYAANLTLALNTSNPESYGNRLGQFFHLAPFGSAEQHPYLQDGADVYLFPQFEFKPDVKALPSEAEFYIGFSGLVPPQNLSLLFQVADGTANPLAEKPAKHINWSYLRKNRWVEFAANDVQDATGGLLNSGIVVLPLPPRPRTTTRCWTPGHWIRAAVHEESDAVCRFGCWRRRG